MIGCKYCDMKRSGRAWKYSPGACLETVRRPSHKWHRIAGVPAEIREQTWIFTVRNVLHLLSLFQHCFFVFLWRCDPSLAMASSFMRFLDHTKRRITVGRTPLDEWSARRRDLYLTTLITERHPCPPGGIRTHDLSRRVAADLRLRPRGHWDRHPVQIRNMFWNEESTDVHVSISFSRKILLHGLS